MSADYMKPEDILTPNQLAERLQVGVSWVYEKSRSRGSHNRNPLPVLRCGRYLRFYWIDVCEWLWNGTNEQAIKMRPKQRK
jgi:predicted DNA-binding transcriptional regulator AlpA